MSYPINYPTPQGANVQIFNAPSQASGNFPNVSWIKPQGASFVWFTLIGGGGPGDGVTGGGSGAVTNFMCPAFLIPDQLVIRVDTGLTNPNSTDVIYQQKNGVGYTLLTAQGTATSTGGAAMTANAFTAIGFFQSVAGQNGVTANQSASSTTFLSGGAGPTASTCTGNYGYTNNSTLGAGFFQLQPIIVGVGGSGTNRTGIGCGGGGNSGAAGNGMVVIITW